jgi:1,2-diacylglycerol 3-alpha-glucosyltransferase
MVRNMMKEKHQGHRVITIVVVNMVPYHYRRMAFVHQSLSALNLQLHVIELTQNSLDHPLKRIAEKIPFRLISLLDDWNPYHQSKTIAEEVQRYLNDISPVCVIVHGYAHGAMREAVIWARRNGRSSILMSESQWCDRPRNLIKEWMKGWWIRHHFDAAFVGGERSTAYLNGLGFPRDRIWRGYDVVDNQAFADGAERARAQDSQLRAKLGMPDYYFLYVGRLSPEKNLIRLLDAYSKYSGQIGDKAWGLVIVGSGPQETELKVKAEALGLKQIVWPGFQQIDTLPLYYGLSSCLILPSISETWGLVINEALACGLPVLVSDRCGAAGDIVFPGVNGFVFDPYDFERLASLMKYTTSGQVDLKAMGESSKRIIANYTPETWARALTDCIKQTATRKGISFR